jgi:hypothetical protein
VDDLVGAVAGLTSGAAIHSVVVAVRPGAVRTQLAQAAPTLREVALMPLDRSQVDALLARYDATSFLDVLRERNDLNRLVTPDLLSDLAISARSFPADAIPRTEGEIYRLHGTTCYTVTPAPIIRSASRCPHSSGSRAARFHQASRISLKMTHSSMI